MVTALLIRRRRVQNSSSPGVIDPDAVVVLGSEHDEG
jgi:hypothetical protein